MIDVNKIEIEKNNIFNIISAFPQNKEITETLASSESVRIERIISNGQTTDDNYWYDQSQNEFVIVLQGDARLFIENKGAVHLNKGDYLTIPTHCRHKVTYTSVNPACIWLAVFF